MNIDSRLLAEEIYNKLKNKGVGIGNNSIVIIDKVIKNHIETDRRTNKQKLLDHWREHYSENSAFAGLVKSARNLFGLSLPQAKRYVEEIWIFKNHQIIEEK